MPKQNAVQRKVNPSITHNSLVASDWRNVSRTIQRTVRIADGSEFMPTPPSRRSASAPLRAIAGRPAESRVSPVKGPVWTMRPSPRTASVSHNSSTSGRTCETNRTVFRGLELANDLAEELAAEEIEPLGRLVENEEIRVR